jgi:hypothetical protein
MPTANQEPGMSTIIARDAVAGQKYVYNNTIVEITSIWGGTVRATRDGKTIEIPPDATLQEHVPPAGPQIDDLIGLPRAELEPRLKELDPDLLLELAARDSRPWLAMAVAELLEAQEAEGEEVPNLVEGGVPPSARHEVPATITWGRFGQGHRDGLLVAKIDPRPDGCLNAVLIIDGVNVPIWNDDGTVERPWPDIHAAKDGCERRLLALAAPVAEPVEKLPAVDWEAVAMDGGVPVALLKGEAPPGTDSTAWSEAMRKVTAPWAPALGDRVLTAPDFEPPIAVVAAINQTLAAPFTLRWPDGDETAEWRLADLRPAPPLTEEEITLAVVTDPRDPPVEPAPKATRTYTRDRGMCPACGKEVSILASGGLRRHQGMGLDVCPQVAPVAAVLVEPEAHLQPPAIQAAPMEVADIELGEPPGGPIGPGAQESQDPPPAPPANAENLAPPPVAPSTAGTPLPTPTEPPSPDADLLARLTGTVREQADALVGCFDEDAIAAALAIEEATSRPRSTILGNLRDRLTSIRAGQRGRPKAAEPRPIAGITIADAKGIADQMRRAADLLEGVAEYAALHRALAEKGVAIPAVSAF